jgi:hypothetical protein
VSVSLVALTALAILAAGQWFAMDALWDGVGDSQHGAWVKMALYVGGAVAVFPIVRHQLLAIARDFNASEGVKKRLDWLLVWGFVALMVLGLVWRVYEGLRAAD